MFKLHIVSIKTVLLLLCSFHLIKTMTAASYESNDNATNNIINRCGKVFLTVSSFKHTFLELNWLISSCKSKDPFRPDQIVLFNDDPRMGYAKELVQINPLNHVDEYYRTDIPFGHPSLPGDWDYVNYSRENSTKSPKAGNHCFPFWIASLRDNRIIYTECLKIQPTWMDDNRKFLENLSIGNAFIPGTHNSGTAQTEIAFVNSYTVNQDWDVWTQLVFGIRYLDIRVGYYKISNHFTINHDLVSFGDIEPLLDQVLAFLRLAPKEIVILDIHRFPYPRDFPHEKFVQILKNKFGQFAFPQWVSYDQKGVTFKEIWSASSKNLIICYNHRNVAEKHSEILWRPLTQYWGDKRNPSDLKEFIQKTINEVSEENVHNRYTNPLWSIMAELTPSKFDVIFGQNNLRQLADRINSHVTKWFRDLWVNETNIVSTDFFLGNDIINVAIEENIRKSRKN